MADVLTSNKLAAIALNSLLVSPPVDNNFQLIEDTIGQLITERIGAAVTSGLNPSVTGSDMNVTISSGTAFCRSGFRYNHSDSNVISIPNPSTTRHNLESCTVTAGKVTVQYGPIVNADGTKATSGSNITLSQGIVSSVDADAREITVSGVSNGVQINVSYSSEKKRKDWIVLDVNGAIVRRAGDQSDDAHLDDAPSSFNSATETPICSVLVQAKSTNVLASGDVSSLRDTQSRGFVMTYDESGNYTGLKLIGTVMFPGTLSVSSLSYAPLTTHLGASNQVNDTSTDGTKDKHVSNSLAKSWTDHISSATPHVGVLATAGHNHSGTYQPLHANLTSAAALSYASTSFVKMTGANTFALDTNSYVVANGAISGATKTKITYDAKGLVTAGADATTADIADSLNKRYVSDAQLAALHPAVTISDTSTINLTLSTQALSADVIDGSITYAKIQNISAADKLLGRVTAGAGSIEEITCTAFGRSLLDDADNTAARATLGLGNSATLNTGTTAGTVATGNHAHSGVYQPVHQNLTDIAGSTLSGASGFVIKTGANTWGLDTSTYSVSSHTHSYLPLTGGTLSSNLTVSGVLSVDGTTKTDGAFYAGTTAPSLTTRLNYDGYFYATKVYSAVFNDYAEMRHTNEKWAAPGMILVEDGHGNLTLCEENVGRAAFVVTDTHGMCIGEQGEGFVPVAVAGRVLVYVHDRKKFKVGDAVCATYGTYARKMSWLERILYPDRILGIVSEVPTYKTWGTSNVEVNDRIWIII